MIDRYLQQGNLYAGILNGIPITVCVVLTIDDTTVEIKNLAVSPCFQRRGFGRLMLEHVEKANPNKSIILGTGETHHRLLVFMKSAVTVILTEYPTFSQITIAILSSKRECSFAT